MLVVALVAACAAPSVGCGDAGATSSLGNRSGYGATDHDPDDIGDQSPDEGNDNADTLPVAPSNPGQTAAEFDLVMSNATPAVDLGQKLEIDVTLTPKNGFTGAVTLAATGLPTGATAAFAPASVTLGAAAVTAKLTIDVAVTSVPSAPGASSPIEVAATSGSIRATANANFKINPRATLVIPLNIDALRSTGTNYLDQWGPAFGANPTPLRTQEGNPIVFTVYNADSKLHIVHGNNGFQHGSTTAGQEVQANAFEMQNGEPRTRSLAVGANITGYPHEGANGQSAGFRISVQAAP